MSSDYFKCGRGSYFARAVALSAGFTIVGVLYGAHVEIFARRHAWAHIDVAIPGADLQKNRGKIKLYGDTYNVKNRDKNGNFTLEKGRISGVWSLEQIKDGLALNEPAVKSQIQSKNAPQAAAERAI